MLRRAARLLLASVALAALAPLGAAAAAPTEGAASVSDTTPAPGQTVTVSGSDLLPGGAAQVTLLPEAVSLAEVTVDGDGTFRVGVRIPDDAVNGPRQIVVTAIASDNRYAYLPTEIEIVGSGASAGLSDASLNPSEQVTVTGQRFRAGAEVVIAVFPETEILGRPTAGRDGRLSARVQMPAEMLNGEHVVLVAGPEAAGGFAVIELRATVSGGVGEADPIPNGIGQRLLADLTPSSTTSIASTTTTRVAIGPRRPGRSDSNTEGVLVVVLLLLLVVGGALLTWLRTQDGRYWLERRRAHRAAHRAHRG